MQRSTMTLASASVLSALTTLAIVVSACGGSDPPPATSPSANTAYPPPNNTAYYPPPNNTGYPPPTNTGYPPPQPTGAPTGAPAGTMATPGPLALPCQNDGSCGLHKCNMQFQKCAFPCQTPVDCAAGNQCLMGVCAPKPPGSP